MLFSAMIRPSDLNCIDFSFYAMITYWHDMVIFLGKQDGIALVNEFSPIKFPENPEESRFN